MCVRLIHLSARVGAIAMSIALIAGCASGASDAPPSATAASRLTEAAAKEALFARFGPLSYCDPDYYPDARGDETSAATEQLPAMRADAPVWVAIAARLGFDPASTPAGAVLLAAYRDWKMQRALTVTRTADGWAFDASFGGSGSDATAATPITHVVGTIAADGAIGAAAEAAGSPPRCPICLAKGVMVATPEGQIPVEELRPGDPVWTSDRSGRRVPGIVVRVGSMPVAPGHQVVHLVLADGRSVLVSPGHPLVDGRRAGDLREGDVYDGSVVISSGRTAYDGARTFDLLPSGDTGRYWANGVDLGSTLFR